jgi:hypothetical protein
LSVADQHNSLVVRGEQDLVKMAFALRRHESRQFLAVRHGDDRAKAA